MKRVKHILISAFFGMVCCASLSGAEIWGGKWDNQWMVFLLVNEQGGTVQVTYSVEENIGQPLRQSTPKPARKQGPVLRIGSTITARLDQSKGKGLLHGNFTRPRAANLVLLKVKSLSEADGKALEAAGWKAELIDVEEVQKKVFEGVPADKPQAGSPKK